MTYNSRPGRRTHPNRGIPYSGIRPTESVKKFKKKRKKDEKDDSNIAKK